jgi:hypothetical protein
VISIRTGGIDIQNGTKTSVLVINNNRNNFYGLHGPRNWKWVWGEFGQGTDSWISDLSPRKQGRKTKNLIFETLSTIRRSDAGVAIDRRVYPILLSLWSYVAGSSSLKDHILVAAFQMPSSPWKGWRLNHGRWPMGPEPFRQE